MISYKRARRVALLPSVCLKNGLVKGVSKQFLELTGHSEKDLLSVSEGDLLRLLRADFDFSNYRDKTSLYIFTKTLEPREIDIIDIVSEGETQLYLFEKPNTRFEKQLPYLALHLSCNLLGTAVFLAENFQMLCGNGRFLACLDRPYNTAKAAVGKNLRQICAGWADSVADDVWQRVVDTGEPYVCSAVPLGGRKRGGLYTDIMIVPIRIGDKTKYLAVIVQDVTENVLNRKLIDRQAKQLKEQAARFEAFIYSLSHDLRNSLATIVTGLSLINIRNAAPQISDTLEIVRAEANALRKLADKLPDPARWAVGKSLARQE